MQDVRVGEVWSVLDMRRIRIEFRITRIAKDNGELRAFGELAGTTKVVSFTVSALAKGSRGARLVRHADGHEPYKPKVVEPVAETPTASDFRKQTGPRGMATASPRMEEAFALRYEQGVSLDDLASRYGVSKSTVSMWCTKVRDKRAEQRRLADVRAT